MRTIKMTQRIIYDLGANNGCNIAYYLLKAEKVIAVEANPKLASEIKAKFSSEIASGRLVVENVVLSVENGSSTVPFYIHKTKDVLSQFPEPSQESIVKYQRVDLPSKSVFKILEENGAPYYVKIDLESFDSIVLRALFEKGIRPPFISAESHSIEIFALLVASGGYNSFALLDGKTVPKHYTNHQIKTGLGFAKFSFKKHSAGPFGEDLKEKWLTADNFLRVLAIKNLGWKDIHASNVITANESDQPYKVFLQRHTLKSVWRAIGKSVGLRKQRANSVLALLLKFYLQRKK
jgi:FkbM family methyltransferase